MKSVSNFVFNSSILDVVIISIGLCFLLFEKEDKGFRMKD